MDLSKDDIVNAVAEMSVMDVVELVKMLEERFGVTAAAAVAAPVQAQSSDGGGAAEVEEQTSFNVVLTAVGDKKVNVIKAVRAITGLGLKESKEVVDGAPQVVKEGVNKEEAESYKTQIEEAGGSVELK